MIEMKPDINISGIPNQLSFHSFILPGSNHKKTLMQKRRIIQIALSGI